MASETSKPAVVCVFCGAAAGNNPVYVQAARLLAYELHKNDVHLVYGGGTVGMMGELAKTLVQLSGPEAVHGVIPKALIQVEEGYQEEESSTTTASKGPAKVERVVQSGKENSTTNEFGRVTVVPDMHTRKQLMARQVFEGGPGSGFIALPGGFGTMEEVMEMTTWNQLGIHRVGVLLLNINGYWNALVSWVKNAVQEGFLSSQNASILIETSDIGAALGQLQAYQVSGDRLELKWGDE
ncbi:Lysine decarboxylase [Fusarium albosuccineum]|uniref:Lysine decarboxylase n=1 Tax=Fusarium albosuccineum TaxID=1237068 RepID=A0A8H4PA57_9HYPO|nr:Lysine decarboxylase [Fusarium albosuccineum]